MSRDEAFPFSLVRQVDDNTCVHACLAMATGRKIEDIIEQAGPRPLGWRSEAKVLVSSGLFPIQCQAGIFPYEGMYFATLPSLNRIGVLHRVVAYRPEASYEIYVVDPQDGREGRGSYGAFVDWVACGVALELTYLDPHVL